jgi:hypothetical protein
VHGEFVCAQSIFLLCAQWVCLCAVLFYSVHSESVCAQSFFYSVHSESVYAQSFFNTDIINRSFRSFRYFNNLKTITTARPVQLHPRPPSLCLRAWKHDQLLPREQFRANPARSFYKPADTCIYIAGLIPLSLQLQAQVRVGSLGWCHKSGECAKSCARRSVCFCSQSSAGISTGLLT